MIADSHNRRRPKREAWALFEAKAAYADRIFRSAIGDTEGCIRALERAVEISPNYAPAVLALGSVEYQRKRKAKGRRLLLSLLSMLDDAPDRTEIIDAAGNFGAVPSRATEISRRSCIPSGQGLLRRSHG